MWRSAILSHTLWCDAAAEGTKGRRRLVRHVRLSGLMALERVIKGDVIATYAPEEDADVFWLARADRDCTQGGDCEVTWLETEDGGNTYAAPLDTLSVSRRAATFLSAPTKHYAMPVDATCLAT